MELNEENPKKVPRARKANFSMLEESILQREVENNFDVLRDKHSNSVTNLEKARIWKNVTSKINALGVAPRSVKEIKDKWRNLTSKAKSAFTEYRREKNDRWRSCSEKTNFLRGENSYHDAGHSKLRWHRRGSSDDRLHK